MSKRASLKLYLSLILFGIVAATLTIFRILSYGLADYQQLSPSIIKQRVEYTKNQTFSRLKPTDRISLEFTAEFNNLGSIAILFDNHQEISKGNLLFQIKESTSDSWYFSHEYKVEQLNPDLYSSAFCILTKKLITLGCDSRSSGVLVTVLSNCRTKIFLLGRNSNDAIAGLCDLHTAQKGSSQ